MILQALNDYYRRLKADPEVEIPPLGFSTQKIHFALVVNARGKLVQVRDLRDREGRRVVPKLLIVPEPVKRSFNIEANFMWDNTGYVLGVGGQEPSSQTPEKFSTFKQLHQLLGTDTDDEGMAAVLSFIDDWDPLKAFDLEDWDEIAGSNLVFQLKGERRFVHDRPEVQRVWLKYLENRSPRIIKTCLVTGKRARIARLHPDIKGVVGARSKGAALVSFNLEASRSYGLTQNYNAPVSRAAAFAYATALNHLLRYHSRQKVVIGDATTVFWTERKSPVEGYFGAILNPATNPIALERADLFLKTVRDGEMPPEIDDPDLRFYILGLSPNSSRLSVRFWYVTTMGEISRNLGRHFSDLRMAKSDEGDPDFPGMWHLLRETAFLDATAHIPPLLAGAMMRAIITGAEYPQGLFTAIIGRIRADRKINYIRAAIIKACLVRRFRMRGANKEVPVSLDRKSTEVAYRLGRLFAVLEKVQRDVIPGARGTIKDRYFGSAAATPGAVFPYLIRLAQPNIRKSDYGYVIDKQMAEVLQGIQEFPAHLNLEEQGLFALGYYHQRQAFYVKSGKEGETGK